MQGGISQMKASNAKWFKSHLALKNNSHHQKEQQSTMSIVSIDAPILYKIIGNKIKNNYLKGSTSSIDFFFQNKMSLWVFKISTCNRTHEQENGKGTKLHL